MPREVAPNHDIHVRHRVESNRVRDPATKFARNPKWNWRALPGRSHVRPSRKEIVTLCGVGVLSELAMFHLLTTFRSELGKHADTAKRYDLLPGGSDKRVKPA